MSIVTSGDFTIIDVNDSLNMRLTQESIVIATDAEGLGGDYATAKTTAQVFQGKDDMTAGWTFTAVASAGLAGTLNGATFTAVDATEDGTYVDITGSKAGFPNLTARFTITKVRRGATGSAMALSASRLGFTFTDGAALPADQSIAVTLIRNGAKGKVFWFADNGKPVLTDEGMAHPFNFGSMTMIGQGDIAYVSLADFGAAVQLNLTAVLGDNTLVQTLVRLDFSTAEAGATRNVFKGEWETTKAYSVGDTVLTTEGGWTCIQAHVSTTNNKPPAAAFWTAATVKGNEGVRGSVQTAYSIAGSSWSDASAVAAILAATGNSPIRGDVVTLYNASGFSQTRVYKADGTWFQLAAFFGGDVLVDGTVYADKIAVGAVTSDKIDAGSVTAGKIAAGVIGAAEIAAGAITTEKLAVRSNAAVNIDPYFEDMTNYPGATRGAAGSGYPGEFYISSSSFNMTLNWPTKSPISAEKSYLLETHLRKHNAENDGKLFLTVKFWDAAGNALFDSTGWPSANAGLSNHYLPAASHVPTTTLTRHSLVIGPKVLTGTQIGAVIPANAAFVSFGAYFNYGSTAVGRHEIASIRLTEMARGELIVDGGITALKIAAGAITASKIGAGEVVADKIAANAITTAKIATGAVTANEIATNTITAGKIAANTITAAQMTVGAIGARELAANAIAVRHLVVADWTNMVPNGAFDDATAVDEYWNNAAGGGARYFLAKTTSASYCQTGSYSILLQKADTATSTSMSSKIKFPVSAGEWLYGETAIRTNEAASTSGAYVRISFFDEAGAATSPPYVDIASNIGTTTSWSKHTKEFQVPVGAVTARAEVFHTAASNSQNLIVDRIIVKRMNGGELVVDGALKARHMATELIISNVAQLGTAVVSTAAIGNAAITTAKIGDLQVDTLKIKDNAVTTTAYSVDNSTYSFDKLAAPSSGRTVRYTVSVTIERTAGLATELSWSGLITPSTTDENKFSQLLFYIQRVLGGGSATDFALSTLGSTNKNETLVSFSLVDPSTGGGTATYTVVLMNDYHTLNSNCTVKKQLLKATQFKK